MVQFQKQKFVVYFYANIYNNKKIKLLSICLFNIFYIDVE